MSDTHHVLVDALRREPDPTEQVKLIKEIGRLRLPEALDMLTELAQISGLQSGPAIEAMGDVGDPRATRTLIRSLAEQNLAWIAKDALVKIGAETVELLIAALQDGNPDVRVRFRLISDGGLRLGGWNIDDLSVYRRINDCVACDTSAPPEPAGTVLYATGRHDVGVEFTWPDAAPEATQHYRLYRSTRPDFMEDMMTPMGFGRTTYHDVEATGPVYYYQLRFADCGGMEGR